MPGGSGGGGLNLDATLEELGFAYWARANFAKKGWKTLRDIYDKTPAEFLEVKGIGTKTLDQLKPLLRQAGCRHFQ